MDKEETCYVFLAVLETKEAFLCKCSHFKNLPLDSFRLVWVISLRSAGRVLRLTELAWCPSPWPACEASLTKPHKKCLTYLVENLSNQVRKGLWKEKYNRSPPHIFTLPCLSLILFQVYIMTTCWVLKMLYVHYHI